MIYQLIKQNPVWKLAFVMSGISVLLGLLFSAGDSFRFVGPMLMLYILVSSQRVVQQACTVFEASLPIAARQIFCARVLTLGAIAWFPVLALTVATLAIGRASAWGTTKVTAGYAAVFTVMVLLPLCLGVGKFSVSRKPRRFGRVISFIVLMSAAVVLMFTPLLAVLLVCFTAIAGLLAYAWLHIPASFQIMSADEERPSQQSQKPGVPLSSSPAGILAWAPLFRTLSFSSYAMFIVLGAIWTLTSAWPLGALVCVMMFSQIHFRSHWLFALPVSRHKLFAMLVLPLFGVMTAGSVLSIYFDLLGKSTLQSAGAGMARMLLVNVAAVAAGSLLSVFMVNLAWWRRAGRTLRKSVPPFYFLAFFGGLGMVLMRQFSSHTPHSGESLGGVPLALALRILPDNIFALAGVSIIFLGCLYWIVSQQFCELEMSPVQMRDLRT